MEDQTEKSAKQPTAKVSVEIEHVPGQAAVNDKPTSEPNQAVVTDEAVPTQRKPKNWKASLAALKARTPFKAAASADGSNKFKLSKKGIIAIIAGILLLLLASCGIWAIVANNHGEEQAPEIIVEEPEPEPEPEVVENKDPLEPEPTITDNATYQVPAHKPRYMSMPNIGLYNIPIVEVGKEGDNRLGSPNSDYVIAWYYRSALPGQPGASVMDGHGGDLGTGILKNLPRAAMGAEIIIEMGDGRKYTYIIEEKTYKPIGKPADSYMDVAYQPLRPGVPTLALITCTGKWLRDQQTYDQRLFVRAALRQ